MLETFEFGVKPALNLVQKLLTEIDPELAQTIEAAGDLPTFTLSWILTWYSHDIAYFQSVQRLYDVCLSQHPLFSLYLTAATIIFNKNKLLDEDEDPLTLVFMVFQKIGSHADKFDLDAIISMALKY